MTIDDAGDARAGQRKEHDMTKRYLRQLRADMARVDQLDGVAGLVGIRCWPDRGKAALEAFLTGLERAERKAAVPVYGLWIEPPPDDWDGAPPDPDFKHATFTRAWRIQDRTMIAAGRFDEVTEAVIDDAAGRWRELERMVAANDAEPAERSTNR